MAMSLNSPAFQQNGHIPSKYTCEGEDVSPPLAWEGVPNGAKSLVLIIDDPDAPDPKAPKMVWVHWVVYNMPRDTKSLPENAGKERLPQGALLGLNDFKKTGYGGPCPPIGRHRYFHKFYALDITLDLSSTLRIFARVLDAGPEDCRFRNNARGLFDAGCRASEGAERNPSFLRQ